MRQILQVHFFIILMGIGALAMFLPFVHAVIVRDWSTARAFFYSGLLFSTLTVLMGLATHNSRTRNLARSHLLTLLGAFALLPLMLAVPFMESVRNTSFLNAYFEMVSAITTTGATLFDDPGRLDRSVHLWRATVGWLGGYFMWVTAVAILAPMRLGGFEVTAPTQIARGSHVDPRGGETHVVDPRERLLRFGTRLLPIYVGVSGTLWLLLVICGEDPLVAACHAMSIVATSGISPVGGVEYGISGRLGELMMFAFLFLAISHRIYALQSRLNLVERLRDDPEFLMGIACVAVVPLMLFLRHWLGAIEVDEEQNFTAALKALWGSAFTVLSYLTTTGFVSADWEAARSWSGLPTPGLILMGLAVVGGGVATTAGGVKLLRVYALYKHGFREMEKLVHPSSVGGSGPHARHIRRRGAAISWVFFMLFALSIAVVMLALSLTGQGFEEATALAVAALSTTGPLAEAATNGAVGYGDLEAPAKLILIVAMVLGRLETLAIIALFNPEFWRN